MAEGRDSFLPPAVSRPCSAPLRRPPSSPPGLTTGISGQVRPVSVGPSIDERSMSSSPNLCGSSGYSSESSLAGWSTSPKGAFPAQQPTTDTRPKATPSGNRGAFKISQRPEINHYKRLLEKLADRLSPDEVDRLKRQCGVPAGTAERMRTNRDFMQWLINTDKIKEDDLSHLGILLHYVKRPDLVEKIRRYEEDHGVAIDRRTPTIQSSSSDGTEPEERTRQTYVHDMAERLEQLRDRIERRKQEGPQGKQRTAMTIVTVCLALLILVWPLFWLDDLPGISLKPVSKNGNGQTTSTSDSSNVFNKYGPTITVLGETIFGLALMFTVCWLRQEALFRRLREDLLADLDLLMQPAKKIVKKRVAQV
ncbi:PREDICTED: uncharacterized protein LOC109486694 [Branchiostoma belcheri]|uniref:Uncharacterized protein LOC109486694 n=1 Tax=Branchiostoma belcheri TaxID=7741 RepID=A0A6P5AW21_BRABE|nr:PREDICTED: uncharacterized protein LOC109486694 [Branchiostoma belcheri]